MRVTRLMFAGLSILVAVVIFATAGCKPQQLQQPPQLRETNPVNCDHKVEVNKLTHPTHGVDKDYIYGCYDTDVTWKAPDKVHFTVVFPPGQCPFTAQTCNISDTQPTGHVNYPNSGAWADFKYTITIDGTPFDPHVLGGGGN
jgi:hypothetical protein